MLTKLFISFLLLLMIFTLICILYLHNRKKNKVLNSQIKRKENTFVPGTSVPRVKPIILPVTKRLKILGGTDKNVKIHTINEINNATSKSGIKVSDPSYLFDSETGNIEVEFKSKSNFDVYIDDIKGYKQHIKKGEHVLTLKGKGIISNLSVYQ